MNRSGYIIELEDGTKARTYHIKGLINGKVPVYRENSIIDYKGVVDNKGFPPKLIHPDKLKLIGFAD